MSSSLNLLVELRSRIKRGGDPAFAVAATRLWNNLPLNIHSEKSLQSFKLCLKTLLLCSQPCCFKLRYRDQINMGSPFLMR